MRYGSVPKRRWRAFRFRRAVVRRRRRERFPGSLPRRSSQRILQGVVLEWEDRKPRMSSSRSSRNQERKAPSLHIRQKQPVRRDRPPGDDPKPAPSGPEPLFPTFTSRWVTGRSPCAAAGSSAVARDPKETDQVPFKEPAVEPMTAQKLAGLKSASRTGGSSDDHPGMARRVLCCPHVCGSGWSGFCTAHGDASGPLAGALLRAACVQHEWPS